MRDPAKDATLWLRAPAGVSSEINPGWNTIDGGMEDSFSIGVPGGRTHDCATAHRPPRLPMNRHFGIEKSI